MLTLLLITHDVNERDGGIGGLKVNPKSARQDIMRRKASSVMNLQR